VDHDNAQTAGLVRKTRSAGGIAVLTVDLDADAWTRLVTGGLGQGKVALGLQWNCVQSVGDLYAKLEYGVRRKGVEMSIDFLRSLAYWCCAVPIYALLIPPVSLGHYIRTGNLTIQNLEGIEKHTHFPFSLFFVLRRGFDGKAYLHKLRAEAMSARTSSLHRLQYTSGFLIIIFAICLIATVPIAGAVFDPSLLTIAFALLHLVTIVGYANVGRTRTHEAL
jgi:hypothetical protein